MHGNVFYSINYAIAQFIENGTTHRSFGINTKSFDGALAESLTKHCLYSTSFSAFDSKGNSRSSAAPFNVLLQFYSINWLFVTLFYSCIVSCVVKAEAIREIKMNHSVSAAAIAVMLLLFCICQVESYPQMPSYSAADGLEPVNNEKYELLRTKRDATANQACFDNCVRFAGYPGKPQGSRQTSELTCQGMCDSQND